MSVTREADTNGVGSVSPYTQLPGNYIIKTNIVNERPIISFEDLFCIHYTEIHLFDTQYPICFCAGVSLNIHSFIHIIQKG